ncbi:hypothetical protein E2542_SST02824 [Spatholobus suberectus]|nr:hypothetical protein E2542_SST02824 [Spatholobus suberectus]
MGQGQVSTHPPCGSGYDRTVVQNPHVDEVTETPDVAIQILTSAIRFAIRSMRNSPQTTASPFVSRHVSSCFILPGAQQPLSVELRAAAAAVDHYSSLYLDASITEPFPYLLLLLLSAFIFRYHSNVT